MLKTMYPAQVNSRQTELASAINATQTTIPLVDASIVPVAPNLVTIGTDESAETILYTGKSGNDLTGVTRGFEGVAASWSAGSKVGRFFTAYDADVFRENIEDIAGVGRTNETVKKNADDIAGVTEQLAEITKTRSIRLDSDSFGMTGFRPGNCFVDRVAKVKNLEVTNQAVSGLRIRELWTKLLNEVPVPSPYDYHLINIGFNDVIFYGDKPGFASGLSCDIKSIVGYLRLGQITNSNDTALTYTGAWNTVSVPEDLYGGEMKSTGEVGAYVEYEFSSSKLTIGTLINPSYGGKITISVDGFWQADVDLKKGTGNPKGYSNLAIELSDMWPGTHTLRITHSGEPGTSVFIDYIGIPKDKPPVIIVNGITKMRTEKYADYNVNVNEETTFIANEAIRSALSEFDANVIFVDQSNYDPNIHGVTTSDLVHANDYGHEWIASNILSRWQ
ncbi:hypothetical protein AMS62_03095 [Bacillus sp. FJAT-18019]|nr:hypothetical protein AMS62_03095 [Bacillus sp. FJAT-18019]